MAAQAMTFPPPIQKGSYFKSTTNSSYLKLGHITKRYEVLFRHVFTPVHPHAQPDPAEDDVSLAIPVNKLSHVTHDREAKAITSTPGYKFIPAPKVGKMYKWDGTPFGESFRDDFISPGAIEVILNPDEQSYRYVNDKESLMPRGHYSWWGIKINTDQWPQESKDELAKLNLPHYIQSPPVSLYGNNEFSGELSKLLQFYQSSRHADGKPKPDIYLLLGGTLRYIHEICFIVIVCTSEDKSKDALKSYEPVPQLNPQLRLNGLTNEDGKVIDFSKIPHFYPGHLSRYESWANLVFAFYFEDNRHPLECEKDKIDKEVIGHDKCIKKRPPHEPCRGCKWVCPNEAQTETECPNCPRMDFYDYYGL